VLTPAQFAESLQARRERGETLSSIGASFGVTHEAVRRWLDGSRAPTDTVLILAELLMDVRCGEWPANL
jgi:hypothetical protein